MSDKKNSALSVNIFFVMIFIFITSMAIISYPNGMFELWFTIDFFWFLIMCSGISSNNRESKLASLPILSSQAILIDKLKEDHRSSSDYFLSFELDDGNRKLFKVTREIYANFIQNETGVVTYKEKDQLIEFLGFETNSNK